MSGPWEKYQQPAQVAQEAPKPWERYQAPTVEPQAAPEPTQASWPARLGAAVAAPVVETGLSLRRQVMPHMPEAWRESAFANLVTETAEAGLKKLQEVAGEGPLATTGNIGGEVLTFLGPGAVGAQVGRRALPRALGRYAPATGALTGEAAAIAGLEAARTEGTPEERAEAARNAAIGTAVGYGLGGAVTGALRGLPRSREAQRMIDEGVPLTPGQAAPETAVGRGIRGTEARMGYLPLMGPRAQRMQVGGMAGENLRLMRSIIPDVPASQGMTVTAPGTQGFRELQDNFGLLYEDFWERAARSNTKGGLQTFSKYLAETSELLAKERLDDTAAQRVARYMNNVVGPSVKNPTPKNLQKLNENIRDYAVAARQRGDIVEADLMDETLAGFQGIFGPRMGEILDRINGGYAQLKVLEKAASYKGAQDRGGIFSPDDFTNAVRSTSTPRRVAAGRALMSPAAEGMRETIGQLTGGTSRLSRAISTPATAVGLLLNLPVTAAALVGGRAAVNEPTRRLLTGAYAPSPSLAETLRLLSGATGAATTTE